MTVDVDCEEARAVVHVVVAVVPSLCSTPCCGKAVQPFALCLCPDGRDLSPGLTSHLLYLSPLALHIPKTVHPVGNEASPCEAYSCTFSCRGPFILKSDSFIGKATDRSLPLHPH